MERILLIDDQSSVLKTTGKFLAHFGYEVKVAHNGKEGIDLFDSGSNIDLIITDIKMPGVSGNDVARNIRNSCNSDIPIVAITGSCDDVNPELFNYVLEKPFKLKTLLEVVKTLDQMSANKRIE